MQGEFLLWGDTIWESIISPLFLTTEQVKHKRHNWQNISLQMMPAVWDTFPPAKGVCRRNDSPHDCIIGEASSVFVYKSHDALRRHTRLLGIVCDVKILWTSSKTMQKILLIVHNREASWGCRISIVAFSNVGQRSFKCILAKCHDASRSCAHTLMVVFIERFYCNYGEYFSLFHNQLPPPPPPPITVQSRLHIMPYTSARRKGITSKASDQINRGISQ